VNIPGTGLGLVICKRIVRELGGTIDVKTKEGKGTTFIIHLPVAQTKAQDEPGPQPTPSTGSAPI
jgi:signal transduction histidine kinase